MYCDGSSFTGDVEAVNPVSYISSNYNKIRRLVPTSLVNLYFVGFMIAFLLSSGY